MRQAKQPVSATLAGPHGHPLHPLLVTVPIGAWLASLAAAARGTLAAERYLPVPVIVAHGLLAVVTLVLALLAAAGGS